jgi:hypothetical protein
MLLTYVGIYTCAGSRDVAAIHQMYGDAVWRPAACVNICWKLVTEFLVITTY